MMRSADDGRMSDGRRWALPLTLDFVLIRNKRLRKNALGIHEAKSNGPNPNP